MRFKSSIVIDKKGNWKLMNKQDAAIYSKNHFEVYSLLRWIFKFSRHALKAGILLWIVNSPNKFNNNDLRLAFLVLILIELNRMVKW